MGWGISIILLAAIVTGRVAETEYQFFVALLAGVGLVYLAWLADPAWSVSMGLALSVFSSNWAEVGLPLGPDRLVFLTGAVAALSRSWKEVRWTPIHWLLVALSVGTLASATSTRSLSGGEDIVVWFDRVGVMPLLALTIAPIVYRTAVQRQALLIVGVGLGAYLGATAFFETVGPEGLVLPRYIVDPGVGIHIDRARGPFAQAVGNGLAMYGCALIAAIAALEWRRLRSRGFALFVVGLCSMGMLFTVTRSVWLAGVIGTLVAVMSFREFRRYLVPVAVGGLAIVATLLVLIPGLATRAAERGTAERPVWDRLNLNSAAIDMINARPITGFGWSNFESASRPYFEQADTYPLTAVGLTYHSTFLGYGAEIGLLGVTIWAAAIVLGVLAAVTRRAPPRLMTWRAGLLAYAVAFLVVANFVNLAYPFTILLLWLWIGLLQSGGSLPGDGRDRAQTATASPQRFEDEI